MKIGLLHPGEMGAAIAATLVQGDHDVMWLPKGRSTESAQRAVDAGLHAVESVDEMIRQCEMILSICPPHAAIDVARQVAESSTIFKGMYFDANAISPATAATVSSTVSSRGAHYVDAAIIGSPPPRGHTRWYLSGGSAAAAAERLSSVPLEIIVLGESPTAASALKMAYASWTKGTAALVLAVRALATHFCVDEPLLKEWARSQPDLVAQSDEAAISALTKGWRWIGEMEEVASAFASARLPEGFGEAAAEIFRRVPRDMSKDASDTLATVLDDLMK